MHKAHYVLINIECDDQTLSEIESSFKLNDSIIRHLIVRMNKAETEPSVIFSENNKEKKGTMDRDNKVIERKNESQLIEKVAETKKDKEMESKSESDLDETEIEESEEQDKDALGEKE